MATYDNNLNMFLMFFKARKVVVTLDEHKGNIRIGKYACTNTSAGLLGGPLWS